MKEVKEAAKELRKALAKCIHRCNHCFSSCLEEDDVKMMADCIRLDKDCIEVCALTMKFLYKKSRFKREVIMLCKNVCLVCAGECEKFQEEHCQKCAMACRDCAQKCDEFLKVHAEAHRQKSGNPTGFSC